MKTTKDNRSQSAIADKEPTNGGDRNQLDRTRSTPSTSMDKESLKPTQHAGLDRFQQILVLYNPISSSGNSEKLADRIDKHLDNLPNSPNVTVVESQARYQQYEELGIIQQIENSDLVVCISGDGTLRKLLRPLSEYGTPVYMIPAGHESLFSKTYGMTTQPSDLMAAMRNVDPIDQYFATIQGNTIEGKKSFFTMASMGLDSLTLASIGVRKSPVNVLTYGWHALLSSIRLHHPLISVTIDGMPVIQEQYGYFIVANSPAYARGLNLVPAASSNYTFSYRWISTQ